jgi:uncharacterized protein (DUF4415 family)
MASEKKVRRAPPKYGTPDAENPEWTPEMFARARTMREVMPEIVEAMKRGRPKMANPKTLISIRVAADVLAEYKALGRGWQTEMGSDLAAAIKGRASRSKTKERRTALKGARRKTG